MGHEGVGSAGKTYTKGVTTAKLRQVVESFVPVFDLNTVDVGEESRTPLEVPRPRKALPPVFDENGKVIRSVRK